MRREVILVDRRHDRSLAAMREEARSAVARACGGGGGPPRLACFQALANVVAGHMGGALVRGCGRGPGAGADAEQLASIARSVGDMHRAPGGDMRCAG